MKHTRLFARWVTLLGVYILSTAVQAIEMVTDPRTKLATYISQVNETSRKSGRDAAEVHLRTFRKKLGIKDIDEDLRFIRAIDVPVGKRYTFQQLAHGRRVVGAAVSVILLKNDRDLYAISSSYSAEAARISPELTVDAQQAIEFARKALPRASHARARELVVQVVPGVEYQARMVWLVELIDESVNSAYTYAINARDGLIEDSSALRHSAKNRLIIDEASGDRRAEGRSITRNKVVDDAYDYAGMVYDYFAGTHGFDSFDNKGAQIHTTVNKIIKRSNGRPIDNAYYQNKKMVYSPGLMTLDVLAHEFTHGVVEATAGLIYKGQSGALNESYADIFAVTIDSDNWLLGEEVAPRVLRGRKAMRSVASPNQFKQPAKVSEYRKSCGVDHDGVHINSGIPNKGFYEVAKIAGRQKAAKIYFQALTTLTPKSDFNAHVQATLDATKALYPEKLKAVEAALASVGLTTNMNIPVCGTPSCPVAGSTGRMQGSTRSRFVDNIAAAYRLRDDVFKQYQAIGDYSMKQFGQFSGDLANSVFRNPSVALETANYVRTLTPMINSIGDGELEHTVDQQLIDQTHKMVDTIVGVLKGDGKAEQADKLARNVEQFELDTVAGKTYKEAMDHIREVIEQQGTGSGSSGGSQSEGKEGEGKSEQEGKEGEGESEQEGKEGEDESEQEGKEGEGKSEQEGKEGEGRSEQDGKEGRGQSPEKAEEGQGGATPQLPPEFPKPGDLPDMPPPQNPPPTSEPPSQSQPPGGGGGSPVEEDLEHYETPEGGECC